MQVCLSPTPALRTAAKRASSTALPSESSTTAAPSAVRSASPRCTTARTGVSSSSILSGTRKRRVSRSCIQFRPTPIARATFPAPRCSRLDCPGPPLTDALGRIMLVDQVYDPKTTRTLPTGEVVRDPFPGGVIPPGQLDPVALAIQNYIPKANVPGLALNNYVGPNYTDYQHTTNWSVKLDHQISPPIKLSGFYNRTLTYNPNSNGLPGPINQPAVTNNSSN